MIEIHGSGNFCGDGVWLALSCQFQRLHENKVKIIIKTKRSQNLLVWRFSRPSILGNLRTAGICKRKKEIKHLAFSTYNLLYLFLHMSYKKSHDLLITLQSYCCVFFYFFFIIFSVQLSLSFSRFLNKLSLSQAHLLLLSTLYSFLFSFNFYLIPRKVSLF